MNDLNLPEPIAAYFQADRQDPDAVARCFTAQAVVKDENRTHTGLAAIRAWKAKVDHLDAQRRGRVEWYVTYAVRVARVERAYGFDANLDAAARPH